MVSQKKWETLSANEKIETLHTEVKAAGSNTRSLKKAVSALAVWVNDIRRFLGMNQPV